MGATNVQCHGDDLLNLFFLKGYCSFSRKCIECIGNKSLYWLHKSVYFFKKGMYIRISSRQTGK